MKSDSGYLIKFSLMNSAFTFLLYTNICKV